jgi:hypothetical protein
MSGVSFMSSKKISSQNKVTGSQINRVMASDPEVKQKAKSCNRRDHVHVMAYLHLPGRTFIYHIILNATCVRFRDHSGSCAKKMDLLLAVNYVENT